MSSLAGALVVLLAPQVAQLDFRGHAPTTVQQVLDAARPQLDACLRSPPPPPKQPARDGGKSVPVVVEALPSEHLVTLAISQGGQVAKVDVEGPSRLDAVCVKHALIRLEFGKTMGSALVTQVKAPLRCDATTCSFPWTTIAPRS